MPPKEKRRPNRRELASFVTELSATLVDSEQAMRAREGRATRRRLNSYEYENVLRDLLAAPWLKIRSQLPEDGESHRFNKISEALDVSYVQMTRYLGAADYALREVMRAQFVRPVTTRGATTRGMSRD